MQDNQISTETIWALLSSKLGSFIRSRVADEQAASDLLQETFLRIHENLGSMESQERIPAWVFQIARNLITDHYRSNRRKEASIRLTPEPIIEVTKNINSHIAGWLPVMIQLLPEKYRLAVELYEIDGLPQQEIAERLGISLSGAKSRVQRGRHRLRKILNDCCSFELDRRGNVLDYERNEIQDYCDVCDSLQSPVVAPTVLPCS
jgi:RNA polymerase sigma-70 factor (ECF subfamily)